MSRCSPFIFGAGYGGSGGGGGGATLTIEVYLDEDLTIPYVDGVDFGVPFYIKIDSDFSPTDFKWLIANRSVDLEVFTQTGNEVLAYTANWIGDVYIYAQATDGSIIASTWTAITAVVNPDALAQAYITAHNTASGQTMADYQQSIVNQFSRMLKGFGTTNGEDLATLLTASTAELYLFTPVSDTTASLAAFAIDFFEPSTPATMVGFISGDARVTGLTGGSGKYMNLKRSPNTYGQNNCGLDAYNRTRNLVGELAAIHSGTHYLNYLWVNGSGTMYIALNSSENGTTSQGDGTGLFSLNRISSANYQLYRNGIEIDSFTKTSSAPSPSLFKAFAYNGANRFFTGELSLICTRTGLTLAQMQDWNECIDFYRRNIIQISRNV